MHAVCCRVLGDVAAFRKLAALHTDLALHREKTNNFF